MNYSRCWQALCLWSVLALPHPVRATGNIDPPYASAWSESAGWLNFNSTHGNLIVRTNGANGYLTGFAWAENVGWIKLSSGGTGPFANDTASNWGVNLTNNGVLSGFAWSESVGWINFAPTHGGATMNPATGFISGDVWSETIGWIRLTNLTAAAPYGVRKNSLPPVVSANPADLTVAPGTNALFNAFASGSPAPTIQWQISTAGSNGPFGNITGNPTALTPALTLAGALASDNGTYYRAVFSNIESDAVSTAARLSLPTNAHETWRFNHFGIITNSGAAADLADPDLDGISNLMEFALNLEPNTPDPADLPAVGFDGSYLTLTFRKPASVAGITYHVQVSSDLFTWDEVNLSTNTISSQSDGDGTATLTVRDNVLLDTAPHRFMRLEISDP